MLIFVYGTLKKEFRNDAYLKYAQYVSVSKTKESYFEMKEYTYSLDGKMRYFPSVCTSGSAQIAGELYDVDDQILCELDNLEEEGTLFFRQMMEFECGRSAWMYLEHDIFIEECCPSIHVVLDDGVYYYKKEGGNKYSQ